MKIPLYLKTYNSPFKPLKLEWYFGKVAKGVPYFLPRRWRKTTIREAIENATKSINTINLNKRSFEDWFKHHKRYTKAIPKKIGFDFVNLGWKTKYGSHRFEYSPVWSFVAFGYQVTLTFIAPELDHYWESFLAYHYETDKKLSVRERLDDCIKKFPQTWTKHSGDKKETIDYWKLILKNKYIK